MMKEANYAQLLHPLDLFEAGTFVINHSGFMCLYVINGVKPTFEFDIPKQEALCCVYAFTANGVDICQSIVSIVTTYCT